MPITRKYVLGGVCLGFFQLSTEKRQQIETNSWLLELALPKPKHLVGRNHEAPIEVLSAASRSFGLNRQTVFRTYPFHFVVFTIDCHRLAESFSSPTFGLSQTQATAGSATTPAGFPPPPPSILSLRHCPGVSS
jgi:hypothetical protein